MPLCDKFIRLPGGSFNADYIRIHRFFAGAKHGLASMPACYTLRPLHIDFLAVLNAYYSDHFVLPLPVGHRFPMEKYGLVRDGARKVVPDIQLLEAPNISDGVLALAHDSSYIRRVVEGKLSLQEQKIIGFPWSLQMVERSRRSVAATVEACRTAMRPGVALNLAGGTHHAYADHGAGFCIFNDVAIASRLMQAEQRLQSVAIIDLDVHQGNGTASILANDDSIFTLSIHGADNYPFQKEQSDLDVGLPDGTGDAVYLSALRDALEAMFARFSPQLILFLAGADPHEGDRLGRLKLTFSGLAARDRMVLDAAYRRKIPVAITMAGGYGNDIRDTVTIHLQTIAIAAEYALRWQDNRSNSV